MHKHGKYNEISQNCYVYETNSLTYVMLKKNEIV